MDLTLTQYIGWLNYLDYQSHPHSHHLWGDYCISNKGTVHAFSCSWFSNPVNLGVTEGSSFKRGKTSYPWINQICDGMSLPFLICLTLNEFNTPELWVFFSPPWVSISLSVTDEGCKIIATNLCTLLNFLQRIFISFSLLVFTNQES